MIVPLDDTTRISSDERCWRLEKYRKHKGTWKWEAFEYFTTLRQAVVEAGQREIRLSEAQTIAEAIDDVDRIATKFATLFDISAAADRKQSSHLRPVA